MSADNLPVVRDQGDQGPSFEGRRAKNWRQCTKEDLSAYLDELERCGVPATAARRVGISENAVQELRLRNPAFRDAVAEVETIVAESLEAEGLRRAKDDQDPASAKLLIFFLQAMKPDRYGPKVTIQGIETASAAELRRLQIDAAENPDEYAKVAARMAEAMRLEAGDPDAKRED